MSEIITLFGSLVICFIGLVVPIISILLSVANEGILKLSEQYENDRKQSEANLKEQIRKLADSTGAKTEDIEVTIKELKLNEKRAKAKLKYLNPVTNIKVLFGLLILSFAFIIGAAKIKGNEMEALACLVVSGAIFGIALYISWRIFEVMTEVKKILDADAKSCESKVVELLIDIKKAVAIREKGSIPEVLRNVFLKVEGSKVDGAASPQIVAPVDKKKTLDISILNSERWAAKNVEIGLIFPKDFIVESQNGYKVSITENEKIVRYETSLVHGKTDLVLSGLVVTPLKTGTNSIKTFVKAENIESTYNSFSISVGEA